MLRAAVDQPPSDEMTRLAGLSSVKFIVLLPDTGDLLLVGPTGSAEESLLLDDLLVLLRHAQPGRSRFGCSIDPTPARLAATQRFLASSPTNLPPRKTPGWVQQIRDELGLQRVTVHGVPADSHVAGVIVQADYHMKLVGMGLTPSVPQLPSYLAGMTVGQLPKSMDMLRWWFALQPNAIRRSEDGHVLQFARQTVCLQCDNERLQAGQRQSRGAASDANLAFAERFTKAYRQLSKKYTIYQRLEQLMRLALVAAIARHSDTAEQLQWQPSWLIADYARHSGPVPKEVPSIVNHRVLRRRHILVGVSGGVSIDSASVLHSDSNVVRGAGLTRIADRAAPPADLAADQWCWDVPPRQPARD